MSALTLDMPSIEAAARRLEQGELVAFPTETVYGLGADAENPEAVARIYAAKGRPSNHPVIVHLPPGAELSYWADSIPREAHQLIQAFWPGPLTLILKRAVLIPDAVSGGQDTIGLRCPSHPVARALLRIFKNGKGGIAAPSANKFGHVSPTTAQHVHDEFDGDAGKHLSCILDGGQSEVGIESTILDLSRMATHGPVLLRPGHIGAAQIAAVIGVMPRGADEHAPRVSGALESHYAPHTPVVLIDADRVDEVLAKLRTSGRRAAVIHTLRHLIADVAAQANLSDTPQAYAHDLYAALRDMDNAHSDVIIVAQPPQDEAWQGVNDRLRRAAHGSEGVLQQIS